MSRGKDPPGSERRTRTLVILVLAIVGGPNDVKTEYSNDETEVQRTSGLPNIKFPLKLHPLLTYFEIRLWVRKIF